MGNNVGEKIALQTGSPGRNPTYESENKIKNIIIKETADNILTHMWQLLFIST